MARKDVRCSRASNNHELNSVFACRASDILSSLVCLFLLLFLFLLLCGQNM